MNWSDSTDEFWARSSVKLGLVSLGLLLSALAGWTASSGDFKLIALVSALSVGAVLAMFPKFLFWMTVAAAILVAGTARMYFPELQQIRWLLPISAWLLGLYGLSHLYLSRLTTGSTATPGPAPATLYWALFLMVAILATSVLHWPGADTFVRGTKGYFQMWGLLFALAFYPWSERTIDSLPRFFLLAAWLQIPFALHQFFVLVPMRTGMGDGIVPVDIISGTFGGQVDGGGDNAVLSVFLMIVFAGLLAAWREGIIPLQRMLLLGLPLLIPVALNVSKISIVYAAFVFLVLFGRDIVRKPGRFLGTLVLFMGVLAVLATAYTFFAPKQLDSWGELVEFTYEGNIARDTTNEGELTRGGAIRYWLAYQSEHSILEVLFGYGPGATRADDDDLGVESFANPVDTELKVGRLAVTAVLWEGGLIAFIAVVGMFVSAYFLATRLADRSTDRYRKAMFQACRVAVVLLFLSLWHKHFFVFQLGYQTVFAVIFGYLIYWARHLPNRAGS